MAFEKCLGCGEMVASLKRHFCMGKSSGKSKDESPANGSPSMGNERATAKRVAAGSYKSSEGATETRRHALPEGKPEKGREKPKSIPPAVAPVSGPSEAKSKRGRPRIGEQRDKPWEALKMSERTYYRRQAKSKGEME